MAKEIRFAVPNGSMQERTLEILRAAGYALPMQIGRDDRIGVANGIEFFLRDRENIASLVQRGTFDAGITGTDLMLDGGVRPDQMPVVYALPYSRSTNAPAEYVLAAPAGTTLNTWKAQRPHRIGAQRVNLAHQCLNDCGLLDLVGDEIVKLPGKEEAAVADGLCDSVFVLTETGASLRAHGLVVLEELFTSKMVLFYRPGLEDPDQLRSLQALGLAMRAILLAKQAVAVTFDLRRDALATLDLPSAVSPTVNQTLNPDWVAGQVLIQRSQFPAVLLQLQAAGACGIFRQDVDGYLP